VLRPRLVLVSAWWSNRLLPAVAAVVAARLIYLSFGQGRISVLIVFGLAVGLLPTLYFLAVHTVGFVYGMLGREPSRMTSWFKAGWRVGSRRVGTTE
jgi:hypothetical protein